MEYGYTFKTYIAGGREHYEYGTDARAWSERDGLERKGQPVVINKDFPFPESLLSLVYFDTDKLDLLVNESTKPSRNFFHPKTNGMCGRRWRVWTSWPAPKYTLN